ncbi:MAG: hypothetical protein HFG76_06405 [Hungatella sp.]|nr:hypothetical protein [Hungatella sp.]MCI9635072.1 hypothetical protein [Hungatella sp.]
MEKRWWRKSKGKVSIRLLRADEIKCRVSVINEKGLRLLLFKDARGERRYYTSDRFSVQSIPYNEGQAIDSIVVVNSRGQTIYSMDIR